MTLTSLWQDFVKAVLHSRLYEGAQEGAIAVGVVVALMGVVLAVIVLTTFLLRRYFKRNPYIDHTHRVGVYLLTMLGVLVLLVGAVVGALLPIIPGTLFLLFAFLLLRKYYRSKWIEARIRYIRFKLRLKRAIKRRIHKVHHQKYRETDKNKGLSTKNTLTKKER